MRKFIAALLLVLILSGCTPQVHPPAEQVPSLPAPTLATAKPKPQAWWRDAIFYEIFVRSFYDSNNDGIGDFNGIIEKLDYLQGLGINALWLMPIHPSPSYHGYDVLNYYAVNPEYGTMSDFKRLLNEAHKRNMHIIIDLVLNHTSNEHPFFIDALRGSQSKYHDWYIWSDTDQGKGWHAVRGEQSLYYFGQFCDCMPDLNYRNPEVTAQMENVVKYWLKDVGIDGFRIDAAKHLIEEGQKFENTNATHEWFKDFFAVYKADKPDAYTVGEVYGADASLDKTYTGNQLDEVFNFEIASGILNSVNGGSNSGINSALTFALQDLPDGNYATFLTNHDQNRVMSVLNGDLNKAKLAASLLLTLPGVPFIYYGEEIGMQGEKPDEDIRLPMQWNGNANAGFTVGTPWRVPTSDYQQINVATEDKEPDSLLNHYRALTALRHQHPALREGQVNLMETGDSRVYAILLSSGNEKILVLVNLTNTSISDYKLSLDANILSDGETTPKTLFGDTDAISVKISGGQFSGYKPVNELLPYHAYIFQLN